MKKLYKKNNQGFTLIELLISLAIVAILGAWAINSYQSSVLKANRGDGKAKIMEAMGREERYFSEKNTYTTSFTDLGYSATPLPSDKGFYQITAVADATNGLTAGVTLTATPLGRQTKDLCGNFILSSLGKKTVSTSASNCW